uniref:Type 4 fimbrial biogenesis protein PilX N-terminal domain-containing protein n=1 Tax=candidate division WWE3 bacterium TaxID=2053526 RepID=A0A831YZT6_UNCKA
MKKAIRKKGYIAFTTFLILSAVVLLAGTTLALLSIFQVQQSLAGEKGFSALYLAEGCATDALLSSFYDNNYAGGSETVPEGSCTITVSKVGDNWVITSTATVAGGYTRQVRVNILRSGRIQILSWKEI